MLVAAVEYSISRRAFGASKLKGGCTDSSESTLVEMPHCWKSYVVALYVFNPLVAGVSYILHSSFWCCGQELS